jgi:hypothetical protein
MYLALPPLTYIQVRFYVSSFAAEGYHAHSKRSDSVHCREGLTHGSPESSLLCPDCYLDAPQVCQGLRKHAFKVEGPAHCPKRWFRVIIEKP